MSSPSTSSRLSEEASASAGNTIAGRRLANRSSSLRRARRPRSGFCAKGRAVVLRSADGAEHHRADGLGLLQRGGRQRHAVDVVGGTADQILLDRELDPAPAQPADDAADLDHDLGPDAVAGQEQDAAELGHGGSRWKREEPRS